MLSSILLFNTGIISRKNRKARMTAATESETKKTGSNSTLAKKAATFEPVTMQQ
jgi:hypothetical protein